LDLDDNVATILTQGGFETENIVDANWEKITVKDLLYHSGGWRHVDHNDPMLNIKQDRKQINHEKSHILHSNAINTMLTKSLNFTPGEQYTYSNFGYHLLGRIIEIISGVSYREFITEEILVPLEMTSTFLGKTKSNERLESESMYFDYPNAPNVKSIFLNEKYMVPRPYGGFCLELSDSSGGWVSTAGDLLKFIEGYDSLLMTKSHEVMLSPPDFEATNDSYYAMGWNMANESNRKVQWHTGSLPGTLSTMVKLDEHESFVAIFNSRDRELEFLDKISSIVTEYVKG